MSLYTMYRYVPSSMMFDIDPNKKETNLKVFNEKMGEYVYNKLKQDSEKYIKQIQASKLQYALNKMYNDEKDTYNK